MIDDTVYQLLTVTIPRPSHIPRSRGIYAVNKFNTNFKIFTSKQEMEIIEQACAALGISKSSFGRWCCFYVAAKIVGEDKEHVAEALGTFVPDAKAD